MGIRSWFMVVMTSISLLIFFLIVLSIVKSEVLKCSAITMDLLFLPTVLSVFCFTCFAALLFGAHTLRIAMLSKWSELFIIM